MNPADTVRAADADREAAAEKLRIAAAEGRIDFEELDDRLGQAYRATTYGQLRALVADLPVQPALMSQHDAVPDPGTLALNTKATNIKQSGRWPVPQRIAAKTTTGWITIDFTQATCAHREVAVEAVTRSGWIRLILPEGWAARIGPSSTNTSHISNKAAETADPGAPTVIVTGHPGSGYIKIKQLRRRKLRPTRHPQVGPPRVRGLVNLTRRNRMRRTRPRRPRSHAHNPAARHLVDASVRNHGETMVVQLVTGAGSPPAKPAGPPASEPGARIHDARWGQIT
jgi:hypothetical protein